MSATAIVILVVVVVLVAVAAAGLAIAQRRRRLRNRFGPEYDRAVGEHESRREAEAELAQRERRVRDLDIRPLSEPVRARYAQQWNQLQEQFVDSPADVVAASQVLVTQVITERGYPADDHDQVLADLSVDHATTLERYRAAEQVSATAAAGRASTEDLRQAMIHYRALFRDLLGEPAGAEPADEAGADEPEMTSTEPAGPDVADLDTGDDEAVQVPPGGRREADERTRRG
jgi:hypothetical protein